MCDSASTIVAHDVTSKMGRNLVDGDGDLRDHNVVGAAGSSQEVAEMDQKATHSSAMQKVRDSAGHGFYDSAGHGVHDSAVHGAQAASNANRCNLIINYLPHDADDDSLYAKFAAHGEVREAKVIREKSTKRSLGYGFVKFGREEDALAAIELMNGTIWDMKKIKVSFARPQSDEIKNCKLYVANLPKDMDENAVSNLFSQYGQIIECRVLRRSKDPLLSKGVAFVQFNLKSQANGALELNGYVFPGSSVPLLVKYAEEQAPKGIDGHAKVSDYVFIDQPYLVGINHNDHSSYFISPSFVPSAPYHSPGYNYPAQSSLVNGALYVAANNHQSVFKPRIFDHESMADSYYKYSHQHNHNRKYTNQYAQNSSHTQNSSHSSNSNTTSVAKTGHEHGNLKINTANVVPMAYMYTNVSPPMINAKSNGYNNFHTRAASPSYKVCIGVKNLPKDFNNGQLHGLLGNFGLVLYCRFQNAEPQTTPPTNVGFVTIQGMANAEYAVASLNGSVIPNSPNPLEVYISSFKQEV